MHAHKEVRFRTMDPDDLISEVLGQLDCLPLIQLYTASNFMSTDCTTSRVGGLRKLLRTLWLFDSDFKLHPDRPSFVTDFSRWT